jgi:hypothetical protein
MDIFIFFTTVLIAVMGIKSDELRIFGFQYPNFGFNIADLSIIIKKSIHCKLFIVINILL